MKLAILFILASLATVAYSNYPHPLVACLLQPSTHSSNKRTAQTPITSCPLNHCVGAGMLCGDQKDASGFYTSTTTCNATNLACTITSSSASGDFGSCTPLASLGKPCGITNGVSNCSTSLQCVNGQCQNDYSFAAKYLYSPGDPCVSTDVCHFYKNATFDVSECSNGLCLYIADGQPCTTANQCSRNSSYCDTAATEAAPSTCKPFAPVGTYCALDNYHGECEYDCIPTALAGDVGKCGGAYSLPAGQPCKQIEDCNLGLFCGLPTANNTYGECTTPVTSKTLHKKCEVDSNCTLSNNEYCGCNSLYSTSHAVCLSATYAANFYTFDSALLNCYLTSKCDLSNINCLRTSCQSQMCDYYGNLPDALDVQFSCAIASDVLPHCAATSTSTTATSSSTATSTSKSASTTTISTTTSETVPPPSSTTAATSSSSILLVTPLSFLAALVIL